MRAAARARMIHGKRAGKAKKAQARRPVKTKNKMTVTMRPMNSHFRALARRFGSAVANQ